MLICKHVHTYGLVCVCIDYVCLCMHIFTFVFICGCLCVCSCYIFMCVHVYIYVCIHMYFYVCVYMCIFLCVYICMFMRMVSAFRDFLKTMDFDGLGLCSFWQVLLPMCWILRSEWCFRHDIRCAGIILRCGGLLHSPLVLLAWVK